MSTAEVSKAVETTTGIRIITIVSTRGDSKVKIAFSGTEFAELKNLLQRGGTDVNGKPFSGYNLNNIKCVESVNKTTLEHPKAVIPDGDFNLFLMQYKSKSGGSLTRAEAYQQIKAHIEEEGEAAKNFFSGDKSYTNKSTEELNTLLERYSSTTKEAVSEGKAQAIADVVESVKNAKGAEIIKQLQGLSTDEKLDIVITLLAGMRGNTTTESEVNLTPTKSKEEIEEEERLATEANAKKEEEERLKKEEEERLEAAKVAEAEEKARLKREMEELASGFDDVRL